MDGGKERREMQKKDVRFSFCFGIIFNAIHLWQKFSESKHVSHVRFTIRHSLTESNTSERNIDSKRQVEPNSMISLQSSLGELEGR
ncbi:hypothetical protein PHAVU_010G092600 [Phaseolus vulgaris]|uniref:Uncharacterized protein n=1 Tax=Phaseolus vulgaris TaxID=3885 RepID=V7AN62_PHAVU|nr:hypothetical protein PHAVU_010G092600g [Phaseolus vulgaris]ESW06984.1 hypothetical protein PHAVU_010G092600g [Phaseolus vulgaris]